jgi:hypothetical protein
MISRAVKAQKLQEFASFGVFQHANGTPAPTQFSLEMSLQEALN